MDFTCKLCLLKSTSAENFVAHFNLSHKVSARSLMMCGITDCYAQFQSLERYIQHMNVNHTRPILGNVQRTSNPVAVTACLPLSSQDSTVSELLIKCPHTSCTYKCSSKSTLRSHRFRHHSSAKLPATADHQSTEQMPEQLCSSESIFFSVDPEC